MGTSVAISHWEKLEGEIPASTTLDIDSFLISDLKLVKYLQCFYNVSEDKYKTQEMIGSKENSVLTDQVYSRNGQALDLNVNLVQVSTDGKLRIVNNESFVVSFSILKTFL